LYNEVLSALQADLGKLQWRYLNNYLADNDLPSVIRSTSKTLTDRTSFLPELSLANKSLNQDVSKHPFNFKIRNERSCEGDGTRKKIGYRE
jgi:hypothetical protein